MMQEKRKILFYCKDNATRSLFAEAIFRYLVGQEWEVWSAGERSGGPHPLMLRALSERGIDHTGLVSKTIDELPCKSFELIVTLSENVDQEKLGEIQGEHVIHLPFADPVKGSSKSDDQSWSFSQVRDQIYGRLSVLYHRLNTSEYP